MGLQPHPLYRMGLGRGSCSVTDNLPPSSQHLPTHPKTHPEIKILANTAYLQVSLAARHAFAEAYLDHLNLSCVDAAVTAAALAPRS